MIYSECRAAFEQMLGGVSQGKSCLRHTHDLSTFYWTLNILFTKGGSHSLLGENFAKKRVITKWLALPTRWMAPCKYLFSVKNSAILLCSVNHFLLTNFSVLLLSFGTNKRLQKKSLGRPHTPPRTVFQNFIFGSKNSSCWKCQKKVNLNFCVKIANF